MVYDLNNKPCKFDHNGECLHCDCWPKDCGWDRLWFGNFEMESFDELVARFKDILTEDQIKALEDLRPAHCHSAFCSLSYRYGGCECDCEKCMRAMMSK